MFQYFTMNTCERYGAVVGWVSLVPFLNIGDTFASFQMVGKKVKVGKDQENAQSEKDSHFKNQGGKKPN